jgi:hypothetical protein
MLVTGCKLDEDKYVAPPVAYVSLYNASPNGPELNVLVDNRQINSNSFDYSEHTGYLRFYTGDRTIQFGPYGASNVVADTTLKLENDKAYSIFVVDEYPTPDIMVLNDDGDEPGDGKAMIRFLNLSPDTEAVNLTVDGEATPVFADQQYKEPSAFTAVDAKRYDFTVKSTAGDSELLDVPGINLQPGWYYTVIVRGYSAPPQGNNRVLSAEVLVN